MARAIPSVFFLRFKNFVYGYEYCVYGDWGCVYITVLQKIDNIEAAVFDYETANVMNNIVSVFTELLETDAIEVKNPVALNQLNMLMGECLSAMQNKDYLLLADLLEYKLKPMIGG